MKNKKSKESTPANLDYEVIENACHRIRTPIAIIKESVDITLDEIPGTLTKKQRKILNICKRNIKRLIKEMNVIVEGLCKNI